MDLSEGKQPLQQKDFLSSSHFAPGRVNAGYIFQSHAMESIHLATQIKGKSIHFASTSLVFLLFPPPPTKSLRLNNDTARGHRVSHRCPCFGAPRGVFTMSAQVSGPKASQFRVGHSNEEVTKIHLESQSTPENGPGTRIKQQIRTG